MNGIVIRTWKASFNPRLRAGGDAWYPYKRDSTFGFNPRLRAGGDFYAR